MEHFYLSDTEPETYPTPDRKLVDEFGQWKDCSWPGKISDSEELRRVMDGISVLPPTRFLPGTDGAEIRPEAEERNRIFFPL